MATKIKIENIIRFFGWSGFAIGVLAVFKRDIQLFLLWQLVSNISSFLWNNYLQKRISWDTILSLGITVLAVLTRDEYVSYVAMLVRSFSYQMIFEKVVSQRLLDINRN